MHPLALVVCRKSDFRGLAKPPILSHYLQINDLNYVCKYHILDSHNCTPDSLSLFSSFFRILTFPDQLLSLFISKKFRPLRTFSYILLILFLRPSVVLTIMPNKSINSAAYFFPNLTCIEIQHGVIGSHHSYYCYHSKFELPKSFALWTESDFIILKKLNPLFSLHATFIGLPTLNFNLDKSHSLYALPYILYALQPSRMHCPVDNMFLSSLYNCSFSKFLIVLRQHPSISDIQLQSTLVQCRQNFPECNFVIEYCSVPVCSSVANSLLVVTWHSTIVRESISLDTPVFALSPELLSSGDRFDSYPDERINPLFFLCPTAHTMSKFINSLL